MILKNTTLNYKVLLAFAPILILFGVLGFVIPPDKAVTSGAPAYNALHLIFGALGLLIVVSRREMLIGAFNVGFGVIDILQALASFARVFPVEYFRWTRIDDVLHIVIGAALIAVGVYGLKKLSS